ncbi:MAG: ethanolamine ammonia-lyase reactivating factor EutA [Planctomycetes bacterium]|nr:ethanolamine ammonia-lyase reactivating factor EutA [Planctomycetota bacterium]
MSESVKLIGLDFGTTTSIAVVALARLCRTAVGRMELGFQEEVFRSEMVFTPLLPDGRLDLARVESLLNGWLQAGHVHTDELFGGGALLTGLTAQKENAAGLVSLIRRRLGDALIATADDPCLESWLAFMGNCAGLARQHPGLAILNLDIGGGTTNIALGISGQVTRTGCLFLGARHVELVPGSYRIVRLSAHARALFDQVQISKGLGDELTSTEVDVIMSFYLTLLEAVCTGNREPFQNSIASLLEQARFQMPAEVGDIAVTFSGGVGELIYRYLQGQPWPATTHFGDLGIDLAQRIVQAPIWAESLRRIRPESGGRATVYGLLRHATEVSGSSLFLGNADILPLADLPILGNLRGDSPDFQVHDVLRLVRQSSCGGGIQLQLGTHDASVVRDVGQRIARFLQEDAFPARHPLVFLMEENLGKVLGQYVTRWGALPLRVLVIDEIPRRDAQYVRIGLPRNQVVPVSYYGFLPHGDRS